MKWLVLTVSVIALSACSVINETGSKVTLLEGPPPQVTDSTPDYLRCVASQLSKSQRQTRFGVIDFPDKTGRANFAAPGAFGHFNTQGASDMLASSLMRSGVKLVEIGPPHRMMLDWYLGKSAQGLVGDGVVRTAVDPKSKTKVPLRNIPLLKGTLFPVSIGIYGAITSTDFIPGAHASAGVGGADASAFQNRAHIRIDMRAVRMPVGDQIGGEVLATTTVEKQVVQDGFKVELTRFMGSPATLVDASIGAQRREPMQYSMGKMLDVATADIVAQVFNAPACFELKSPAQTVSASGEPAGDRLWFRRIH